MASQQHKASGSGAGPTRHLEIETKLEIAAGARLPELSGRRGLIATGLASAAEPVVHELDAVYYDTVALDLLQSRLTLRHRTGGEDAGWHLKLPAVAGARTEVGLPLAAHEVDPLRTPVPAALADLVQGAARGRELRPVARIRNRRTVRRLLDTAGIPMVEVADDQVTANRLLPAGPDPGPGGEVGFVESEPTRWRELEVEVLAGDRDQLAAVVSVLRGAGAEPAFSASKLARALNSADSVAAKKPKQAGAAVGAALGRLRDLLITADRALREGTDGGVHDARSAGRRIRSVLTVYSALYSADATRSLRAQLQQLGAVLGDVRDLEVRRARLAAQLVDEPDGYAGAAKVRLEAEFSVALPAALTEVAQYVRSPEYLNMLRDLDAFVTDPPYARRAAKPAVAELSAQLNPVWRDLADLVDRALADPSNDAAFHDVRKAARTLRYAAEAASPMLGENIVVFAAAIEEIEEVLGEHQDALSTAAWLAELAQHEDTDGVAGFVFGRLHAFEQATAQGTLDDFSDAWDRAEDGELLEAFGR